MFVLVVIVLVCVCVCVFACVCVLQAANFVFWIREHSELGMQVQRSFVRDSYGCDRD